MRCVAFVGFVAFVVLALGLACGVASAGPVLVPVLQERSISVAARVFNEKESDSRTADSFGEFDQSLTVHPIKIVSGERHASQGNASQKSTITSGAFAFSGGVYAQSIHPADSDAIGRSLFDVTFDVADAADYSLDGFLRNAGDTPAAGKLEFTRLEDGAVLFKTNAAEEPIAQSGRLEAGAYRLVLDAGGVGNSSAAGGGIDYELTFAASAAAAPTAIPLPPPVWGGLSALVLMVAMPRARKLIRGPLPG
jgi:hypothetical protein